MTNGKKITPVLLYTFSKTKEKGGENMGVILYNIFFQTKNTQSPYKHILIFSATELNAKTIEKQIHKMQNNNPSNIDTYEKCIKMALQALNISFNKKKKKKKNKITIIAIKNICI